MDGRRGSDRDLLFGVGGGAAAAVSSTGDLTPFLAGYFDTRAGAKTSAASYAAIAAAMGVAAGEILFISDLVRELDAAREAGCLTRLSMREGNQPVAGENGHVTLRSFAEIELQP